MRINIKEINISLTDGEAFSLAFHIVNAVKRNIETHWVYHQDKFFDSHEIKVDIVMAQDLFDASGNKHNNALEMVTNYAKEVFASFNSIKA